EIDAYSLGSNQTNHLFDFVEQFLRCFVEENVRFIEEENELGFRRIADLRQFFEQFRQQPQQKRCVEPRTRHQLVGSEHIDGAAAVRSNPDEILDSERWLAKEIGTALILKDQQLALHGADRACRYIAVAAAELFGVLCQVAQELTQILKVDQTLSIGGFD